MKLLLDTHTYLWLRMSPQQLSKAAATAIASEENTLSLSIISLWEMAIKAAKGQLNLPDRSIAKVAEELPSLGISLLDLDLQAVVTLETLPPIHKDPFDRLLIAQALSDEFVLVTGDAFISDYRVSTLW